MYYKHFVQFTYLIEIISGVENLQGWNYINLYCRDNDNKPVDWWYVYKPPVEVIPYHQLGRDFVYITSGDAGRWQPSNRQITANSMLQHTVAPMFRPTYSDYLAVVTYEEKRSDGVKHGNSSLGVLLADELGGVWIGHTVPGLIDLTKDRPSFPQSEMANGHLLVCLSLDLITLNRLATLIKQTSPRFTRIQIATAMRAYLPDWNFLDYSGFNKVNGPPKKTLDLITKNKTLRAKIMIRKPGEKVCSYIRFAKNMNLVLDIYGHRDHKMSYCFSNYSVRNIDRISLKSVEYVHYISSEHDKSVFGVSTAASWQRTGRSGRDQYWTCTGPLHDVSRQGGLLTCVDHYDIWQSFDNFKVKEPEC